VTAFGAFVDVGVHQDGLVHVSELSDRYIRDPGEIVKVHQKVTVTVIDVDVDRKRISLSMKTNPGRKEKPEKKVEKKPVPKPAKFEKPKNVPFNNPFGKLSGVKV
ncbi:MAG: protein Tex, partial [Thermodesulfobacteriota bacterium]|nr:protein Tex [Thermodesulfobacteriota bacterium]